MEWFSEVMDSREPVSVNTSGVSNQMFQVKSQAFIFRIPGARRSLEIRVNITLQYLKITDFSTYCIECSEQNAQVLFKN